MKASLLKDTVKSFYAIGRSVCISGPPGGGKTSIAKQSARELKKPSITVHMPTSLVEDFGVPDIVSQQIAAENEQADVVDTSFGYRLPAWFPVEGGPLDKGRGGFLIFDDRNQADPSIQKVLANIIQERTLHGYRMAEGWWPMSTGNRQSDRAGANRILSHLADRETELEFESNLVDSTRWMTDNEGATEVIAFLQFRPGLLHDFDPQRDKNPTPRSWHEGVSPVIGNVPPEAEYDCFKGAIGEGAAAEFTGFLRIWRDLDDPDMIIANPKQARVPTDSATQYALCGAMAARATEANFGNIIVFAKRFPPDFEVLMISLCVRNNPDVCESSAYINWLSQSDTHSLLF